MNKNGVPHPEGNGKGLRKSQRLLTATLKQICQVCGQDVKDEACVCCDVCGIWHHEKCVEISIELLKDIPWTCDKCMMSDPQKSKSIEVMSKASTSKETRTSKNSSRHTSESTIMQREAEMKERMTELEDAEIRMIEAEAKAQQAKSDAEINVRHAESEAAKAAKILQVRSKYAQIQSRGFSGSSSKSNSCVSKNSSVNKNDRIFNWVQFSNEQNNKAVAIRSEVKSTRGEYQADTYESKIQPNERQNRIEFGGALPQPTGYNVYEPINPNNKVYADIKVPMNKYNPVNAYKYTNEEHFELTPQQIAVRQGLDKVELPEFNGNPVEWPLFITSYNLSTVRCGYSDVENLIRLKRALRGKALEAVAGRLYLPSQVPSIIQRLSELFGRPMKILAGIKEKIRNLPILRENDMVGLIHMSLEVDQLCGTVEATMQTEHLYNPDLQHHLIDKLPGYLRLDWAKYSAQMESVNLNTFREWLINMSSFASRVVEGDRPTQQHNSKESSQMNNNKHKVKERFTIATHDERSDKSDITTEACKKCKICNKGSHTVDQCYEFKQMTTSERWKAVMSKDICGKCLGYHKYYKCPSKEKQCIIDGCQKNHHKLLHKVKTVSTNVHMSINPQLHHMAPKVYFRIIPVTLHNGANSVTTYAFFDEGSSVSLIDAELANKLNLRGPSRELCLTWTKNVQRVEESRCVSLEISGNRSRKYQMDNVFTVTDLNLPRQTMSIKISKNENSHLLGIPIPNNMNCHPMILIGQNHYKLGLPLVVREGKWLEPTAAKTRLGWSIYGNSLNDKESTFSMNLHECGCHDLKELVKNFQSIDTFGVRLMNVPESQENKRSESILKEVEFDGNRYTTGLLWREDDIILPESKKMAERRLECFERKLLKDDNLKNRIIKKLDEYITKGYARKLSPNEMKNSSNSWYLPMFCVVNANKPEKVRLIWDAAAISHGMCLNDALMKGPDQLSTLTYVLYKFREEKVGVSADVAEMFHQIIVKKSDQNAQKFLWRNCQIDREPEEYVMQVQIFGASCSPSISQYVKNVNSDRFIEQYPRASRAVRDNFYVDDYLDSLATVEDALQISHQVRIINESGGFHLKDWRSNSPEVLASLNEFPKDNVKEIQEKGSQISKVLGMHWDTETDTFVFRINYSRIPDEVMKQNRPPTKRELLRVLMCVFDPLGLISSYLLMGKLILRDVWNSSVAWDDNIKASENEKWVEWLKLMEQIELVQIPRCYAMNSPIVSRQVHIFVDASEQAFAAVAYVRSASEHGVEVRQIGSKTRIAPNKPISIPRLELLAAVMGTRLLNTVVEGHRIKFDSQFMWSDSKTVICWINSDAKSYKQFVGLRIGEILESTERDEWKWIGSKINVADEATKRMPNPKFTSDSKWYNGPNFLYQPEIEWNVNNNVQTALPAEEFRVQVHIVGKNEDRVPMTADYERFSSWQKLLRTQATVLRYINNLKATISRVGRDVSPLRLDELERAKVLLLKKMQWECFQQEVNEFKYDSNYQIDKSSELYKYTPFMDEEGILRMRGRITKMEGVSYDTKFPVLMGKYHRVTTLIIEAMHRRFLHRNHEIVISELRNTYVIPQLRRQLQKVRSSCQICKNNHSKPIPPLMGDLPKSRLSPFVKPFSFVGVDCFGPIAVVNGRKSEKRWGVIYTCLTIRAIHIEIANSLSTDSFIMTLKRFMARRGTPIEVTCDNGTNFRGASVELAREMKNIDPIRLQNEFANIKWSFNPPGAPHFGGAWERMIQSVKSNLTEIMSNRRKPTDELLHTVLIDCESIINTRPLTHVPLDNAEEPPLTPNHFLLGSSDGTKPMSDLRSVDDNKVIRRMWVTAEQITKQFWRKWMRDYLPTLVRRTKWFVPTKPLCVGDVVVIAEESQPVRYWPKGLVVEVYAGKDGQIRSAKVQTSHGTYKRPVVKIAVLDVGNNNPLPSVIGVENVTEKANQVHHGFQLCHRVKGDLLNVAEPSEKLRKKKIDDI